MYSLTGISHFLIKKRWYKMDIVFLSIGRRPVMLSSFIMIIIGGAFTTFSPQKAFGVSFSYILYTFGRFC